MATNTANLADGLSHKQETAIVALLNNPTIGKAAQAVQMGERTLHRWLEDPAFSRAYRTARRQAFSHAISLTQLYAPAAVTELVRVMTDPSAPHAARVAASSALLKFGREGIQLDDLAGRVEALELTQQEQQETKGVRRCV